MADYSKGEKPTAAPEELQAFFSAEYTDASSFMDEAVIEAQAKMTEYYKGELPGVTQQDVDDNRSDIVSRDVHDAVQAIMPDLMRIFTAPDHIVEFTAASQNDEAAAEQATDAIRHIFESDNDSYGLIHGALKDGLIRRYAVAQWWHEEEERVFDREYSGLSAEQAADLISQPGVEVLELENRAEEVAEERIEEGEPLDETVLPELPDGTPNPKAEIVELKLRHTVKSHKFRVDLVPPEEIVVSRRGRNFHDGSGIVARRRLLTVDELVAMDYDAKELEEFAGGDSNLQNNELQQARNPDSTDGGPSNGYAGAKRVLYIEGYIKWPTEDGTLVLHKVCALGQSQQIVEWEPVDTIDMAFWTPDPEPHTIIGESDAEKVADIQRMKTEIWRGVLDSLAEALVPRTEVVEGQVNMDDALSNEIGALVRVRQPGMVRPLSTPFVGQQAIPLLDLADAMREERVGAFRAADGLSAESMQSSTKMAVAATISGSKARKELLARGFAANFLRPIFRGLLRLFVENQDKERWMKLRGTWVEIDPRGWNAELDCVVDVAFAMKTDEEKIGIFQGIAEKQEMILQTAGPENPICGFPEYSNTLRKLVQLTGVRNVDAYFKRIDPNAPPKAAAPAAPDPTVMLAQAQAAALQEEQNRKWYEVKEKVDLGRDQLIQDRELKLLELGQTASIDTEAMNAKIAAQQEANNIKFAQAMQKSAAQQQTGPAAPGANGTV